MESDDVESLSNERMTRVQIRLKRHSRSHFLWINPILRRSPQRNETRSQTSTGFGDKYRLQPSDSRKLKKGPTFPMVKKFTKV